MTQFAPKQERTNRTRVLVDFWSCSLAIAKVDYTILVGWKRLGPVLAQADATLVDSTSPWILQGINVYGSFNSDNPKYRNFHHWAASIVSEFPGVSFQVEPRAKVRTPPRYLKCLRLTRICHFCGSDMRGTQEKGIDVHITARKIRLAWADDCYVCVLASSDRDFPPSDDFLSSKGIKAVHDAVPPHRANLSKQCLGKVNVDAMRFDFDQPNPTQ